MPENYNQPKIIGYDPQTGQPNYEKPAAPAQPKITGYDPQTGQPIYEKPAAPAQPKITGYDPQTGQPIYEQPAAPAQPKITGYDPQTGQPIYEQSGIPVYGQTPAPLQKPKKKTGLIAGIIGGIVVLALLAIFVWPKPFSKSGGKDDVRTATENSLKALAAQSDIGAFLVSTSESDAPTGLSLSVDNLGTLLFSLSGNPSMSALNGQIKADVAVDQKQEASSLVLDINIMGMQYKAQIQGSRKGITVTIPELFTGSYFIPLEGGQEELGASVFAPTSGSQYALDMNTYTALTQVFQAIQESQKLPKTGKGLLDDIEAKLEEQKLKKEFTKTKGSFQVGGETVKGTVATLELTTEDLVSYVQFLKSYINSYTASMPQASAELSMFDNWAQSIRDSHAAANLTLDLYNGYLVAFDIEVYDTNDRTNNDVHITGDLGKDPKTTKQAVFAVAGPNGELGRLVYSVKTNEKDAFSCSWDIYTNGESSPLYSLAFDRTPSTGVFQVTIMANQYGTPYRYVLNGNAVIDKDQLTIKLNDLSGEEVGGAALLKADLSSISCVIDRNAKVAAAPSDAKDVLKLTEAEVTALIQEVQAKLGIFANMFGGGY